MRNNIILSLNHEFCSSKVNYNYKAPDILWVKVKSIGRVSICEGNYGYKSIKVKVTIYRSL